MKRLKYIGTEKQQLKLTREEAREIFEEEGHYITDEREREWYKNEIEQLETIEELEKLIVDLRKDVDEAKDEDDEEECEPEDDLRWWYYSRVL